MVILTITFCRGVVNIVVGSAFLVAMRKSKNMRQILPVSSGTTICGKFGRLLFLLVAISAVAFFWRGWWLLADHFAGHNAGTPHDFVACGVVALGGLAIIHLTPLSELLVDDGLALAGG